LILSHHLVTNNKKPPQNSHGQIFGNFRESKKQQNILKTPTTKVFIGDVSCDKMLEMLVDIL